MAYSQRHLPHRYAIGQPLFVTFRLHGSLPPGRDFTAASMSSGKAFVCMDRLLESQRAGPTYLKMPEIAKLVVDAIQRGAEADYVLHAWVIMPNHVHWLITPQVDPSQIMRKLKGATARRANQLLNRTGEPFWDQESFDRTVRGPEEFRKVESYIILNPVRTGLAGSPEEYPWSSFSGGGLKPAAG